VAVGCGVSHGNTAGDDTAGDDTAGDDTAGDDTAGDDTAGDETAGDDTAGDDTAGDDTAGDDTAGDEWRVSGAGQPGLDRRRPNDRVNGHGGRPATLGDGAVARRTRLDEILEEPVRGRTPEEIPGDRGLVKDRTKRLGDRAECGADHAPRACCRHAAEGSNGGNGRNGARRSA
jgi:hypothetical protein